MTNTRHDVDRMFELAALKAAREAARLCGDHLTVADLDAKIRDHELEPAREAAREAGSAAKAVADRMSLEDRVAALEKGLGEAHEAFESVIFGLGAALYETGLSDELRQNAQLIPLMPYEVGDAEEQARVAAGRRLAGFILTAIADRLDVAEKISRGMPPSTDTPQ